MLLARDSVVICDGMIPFDRTTLSDSFLQVRGASRGLQPDGYANNYYLPVRNLRMEYLLRFQLQ